MNFKDITKQKFGRLIAVKFSHKRKYKHYWLFKCECGNETIARKDKVISGHTKSCGCLNKESRIKTKTTHRMGKTKFYFVWMQIQQRCCNENETAYKHYGGRGIKVLWRSFEEFKKDMYHPYLRHIEEFGEKQTTINRINNDGNYCKENCRWATYKEQARNKRNNRLIAYKGKTQCLSAWLEELGISRYMLEAKLKS